MIRFINLSQKNSLATVCEVFLFKLNVKESRIFLAVHMHYPVEGRV